MNITTEFRRKMIIKLIEALRESPSFGAISLAQLKEAVLNSEHQTFQQARSMDEYVYYINEKLKKIRQTASQRFEFRSDAKPNDDRGEQRRECEDNGIADDYAKQTCSQEQASGNARKNFDAFAMDPRAMPAGKKPGNGAGMFQTEYGAGIGQGSPSAGFFGYPDNPSAPPGHFGPCMFGSPRAQEYRPGCGSPRAPKDFFGCGEDGMAFKGEYPMRPGMSRRNPGSRGCPSYEGYPYQQTYGSSDPRHCADFSEYSPLRAGTMSSPGHRQDFGMSQGQRKDFRHGYGHSPYTGTGDAMYSGYRSAECMTYPTGSPIMRDEGGTPGRDESYRMRNDAGLDGTSNVRSGLSGTMQCGPRYKHDAGMPREGGRHGYSSAQSKQEFEAGMKDSGTTGYKDRPSPSSESQPPANKSFVGNVNPSAMESYMPGIDPDATPKGRPGSFKDVQMESRRQEGTGSRKPPKSSPSNNSHNNEPPQSERQSSGEKRQSFQLPDVSEVSSFLESTTALPFEPLKDSLDSDPEVPGSLQSFLKSNNLVLKTVEDRESWCQVLDDALRKMDRTPVTTSRHGEIRSLLTKQKEFLCHPFLDVHDIEEYSKYLSRGEIEHTHLIDQAIRAFTERRKRDAGFVFNKSGESGDK